MPPAASASVFAKQAAARGYGGAAASKAAPKAGAAAKAPAAAAARAKQPPSGAPGGNAVRAKAKAAPAAAPPSGDAGFSDDEEDGGVVTCANRGLLRQMLQGVVEDEPGDRGYGGAAEDRGDDVNPLSQSLRLIRPGSPEVTAPERRNVPTLFAGTSPKASGAVRSMQAAGSAPTLSSVAPVASALRSVAPSTSALSRVDSVTLRPGSPPAIVAAVKAAAAAPKTGAPAPAGSVATGPPSRVVVSAPRPGSRGGPTGGAPPAASSVQPIRAQAVRTGPSASAPSSGASGRSYANIHSVQPKGAGPGIAAVSPSAKVAARPRCGPQAFDMLRKLGSGVSAGSPRAQPSDSGAAADDRDDGSASVTGAAADRHGDAEDDGFVMPDDSDDEASPAARPVAGAGAIAPAAARGRPPSDPLRPNAGSQVQATTSAEGSARPPVPRRETAAEYVERLQRGMGDTAAARAAAAAAATPASPSSASGAAPSAKAAGTADGTPSSPTRGAAARARSSDPRPSAGAGAPAAGGPPQGPGRGGPRARSSDPRAAVAAARQSPPWPGDSEEESSDEDIAGAGRGRGGRQAGPAPKVQWKADIKSLVQSYAREERAREEMSAPSAAPDRAAGRRPPKAPVQSQEARQGEELLFSRKPREVDYTPATVESYKEKFAKEVKMGSLGPDLDDDDLLKKKAIQEKVKQFSKELHRINAQRQATAQAQPAEPKPKPEPKPNARAKALEFAKNAVPKPRVAPKVPAHAPSHADAPSRGGDAGDGDAAAAAEQMRALEALELRHFEEKARVAQIKEFLEHLPL